MKATQHEKTIETTNREETLEKFRRAIPVSEVYEFSTTRLDRLGVPLACVAAWTDEGAYYDGFGYGAGETGASLGAWGEIMESYFADRFIRRAPRIKASFAQLKADGRSTIEPPLLCLNAGSNYSSDRELTWIEINNLSGAEDKNKTLVPLEAVAVYPSHAAEIAAENLLFRPITNGLGAGSNLAQAIAHGALETVQRDGNCVTFRAMDLGQRVELDAVKSEETRELLEFLDGENIEIIPKLAGIVAGIPVIYVVGYDRDLNRAEFSMQISACGEAAHPDREIALNKALREYISGRARKHFMHGTLDKLARVAPPEYVEKMITGDIGKQESRALAAVLDWAQASNGEIFRRIEKPILETRSTIKFSDLPTREFAGGDWEAILAHLQKQFAAQLDTEILYADFSDAAPEGIYVARAVVPRMEGETMSYGRIGRRNLERLLERQKSDASIETIVGFDNDARPANALKIHLTETDAGIYPNAWLNPEAIEKQVGEFYALYREPESFSVGRILQKSGEERLPDE